MSTLYQKYRPQKFEDILEQNHIKITLGNEIDLDKISHAYLFCGPRGIGKTTIARIFSKAVNCTSRKDGTHEPCNVCDTCKNITEGKNLDIIEIDAASHTGVDNVRENIISVARVATTSSKNRVFIIDEVHMLSVSAFNALLKVMEEPPKNVVFILCTTEVHKIPDTIISRCQRFDFRRISIKGVVTGLEKISRLEGVKIDKKILEEIARHSEGHMRDAKSLLGQVMAVGGKEITQDDADLIIPRTDVAEVVNLIELLAKKEASEAILLLNRLIEDGISIDIFVNNVIEVLRKLMLASISPALMEKIGLEMGDEIEIKLSEINKNLTTNRIIIFLDKFIKAKMEMKNNFIAQLPIEIAITQLCMTKADMVSQVSGPQPMARVQQVNNNVNIEAKTEEKKDNIQQKEIVEKTENQEEQKEDVNTSIKIGNNIIMNKWNEVLALVKKYNYSLVSILGACKPMEVMEGKITIVFKYKFHKDRIDTPEIATSVERVLREVYGENIKIVAVVDEKLDVRNSSALLRNNDQEDAQATGNPKNDDNTKLMDDLLKTFGGKVVN